MIVAAAEKNYPLSQFNLSLIYYEGDYGLAKDYKKAIFWMKKAAENNYTEAQCALSKFYFEGTAIPKDLNKSYFWAYISMKNGYKPAEKVVKFISEKLSKQDRLKENKKVEQWLNEHKTNRFSSQVQNFPLK